MITLSCYVAWETLYIWYSNILPETEYTSLEVGGLTSPVCDIVYSFCPVFDIVLTAQSLCQDCAVYCNSKMNFVYSVFQVFYL